MGCSHLNELNMSSFLSSSSSSNPNTSLPQSTSLLALCNYQANGTDQQSRTELMGSSRWNPTPEQLLALEGMYRQGTRTPSAEQIQHIASQLRRFGKIEGKNVFYWFQNHKAREQQKRRRYEIEMMNPEGKQHIHPRNTSLEYKKESGLRKTGYYVEQTKNWTPSNCSKHTEESISMHRVEVASESGIGPHGWSPFDEKGLHQRKGTADHITSNSKLMDTISTTSSAYLENFNTETKTLELFPLCRDDDGNKVKATTSKKETETINSHFTPSQFIEFLPLKN